jgi:hypothetical protein
MERCYPCEGCTLGSGSAPTAWRLAKACGCGVFVVYTRSWSEIWPVGSDRAKRIECWDFLRYVVAPSRAIAKRRVVDVCAGVDADDVLVVVEDDARVLVGRQAERVGAAMRAAVAGDYSEASL